MTPELSRHLARMANQYDGKEGADRDLAYYFRHYVREHEDEINSIDDLPAEYALIVENYDSNAFTKHPRTIHVPAEYDEEGNKVLEARDINLEPEYHRYYFFMDDDDVKIISIFSKHHVPMKLSMYPQASPCEFIVKELCEYSHPVFEDLKECKGLKSLRFFGKVPTIEYEYFVAHQHEMDVLTP